MGPVSVTRTVDAPRERVFAVVSDLAMRPAFTDHFQTDFHLQRIESAGVGAACRYRAGAPRFGIWMESVIDEVEGPHRLVERGRGSRADRMKTGTAWELVDGPTGTTEVTVSFWAEPDHPIDKLKSMLGAERWYSKQWLKSLERLASVVESGEPVPALQVAGADRI